MAQYFQEIIGTMGQLIADQRRAKRRETTPEYQTALTKLMQMKKQQALMDVFQQRLASGEDIPHGELTEILAGMGNFVPLTQMKAGETKQKQAEGLLEIKQKHAKGLIEARADRAKDLRKIPIKYDYGDRANTPDIKDAFSILRGLASTKGMPQSALTAIHKTLRNLSNATLGTNLPPIITDRHIEELDKIADRDKAEGIKGGPAESMIKKLIRLGVI